METGWKYPDRLKERKRLSHHGETEQRKHHSNNGTGGWRWGGTGTRSPPTTREIVLDSSTRVSWSPLSGLKGVQARLHGPLFRVSEAVVEEAAGLHSHLEA